MTVSPKLNGVSYDPLMADEEVKFDHSVQTSTLIRIFRLISVAAVCCAHAHVACRLYHGEDDVPYGGIKRATVV